MTTTPILLLAPGPGITFVALPSGSVYVSGSNSVVTITNGSVSDQLALIAQGCATLAPNAGGNVTVQTGTSYTVQSTDNGANIVFNNASAIAVTLAATSPVGFALSLYQGGAGQITASAASGGSVVTPNVGTTPGQYTALYCICIANVGGAAAQWDVIAVPAVTGGGIVGASTLANLYSQDTSAHYAQYTVAQVFSDSTTANNGYWLKTGTGNGAGNWTQQSAITLASLNAAIIAEAAARAAADTVIIAQRPIYTPIWNDDPTPYVYVITDGNSNIVDGVTAAGKKYTGNAESLIIQPLWADETYGLIAITDPNNNLIYGQTLAGVAWPPPSLTSTDRAALNLAEATFGSIWDETYALPFTDSSGKLLLGLRRDGGVDIPKLNLNLTGWLPVINPTDGGLWAGNGTTEFKIAAPQGATALSSPPYLSNGIVQWLDSNVTPWEQREYNFSGAGNLPSGATSALHVLQYGESTSVGANGGVGGLLTTSPVAPTQAFMFSPDHRTVLYPGYTAQANDGTKAFDAQQISLVSLQEVIAAGQSYWGESHGSGLAYSIINIGSLATSSVTLHSSHGCSQEIVSRLGRGTQLYKNLERGVERAYAMCRQGGVAYSIPGISYVQGINDYATSEATWNAAVVTLQSNLTSDLNAITGASAQIPLFIVQYACWTCPTFGGGGQAAAPAQCQGMIDLYNANPTKIILVGNSYHLNYFGASGAVHMLAQGYRMQGEEIGRATSEAITGGVSSVTPPLFATACTASHGSSTLTVTFNNTTLLDIDTSIVTDPGQYGLRLTDSGGSPIALSSIVVVGSGANAQITATTASQLTIGGTYNLGIANYGTSGNAAGPITGPRSCIRDSAPESYSALCGGGRMYRYACTQSIPVTVGA